MRGKEHSSLHLISYFINENEKMHNNLKSYKSANQRERRKLVNSTSRTKTSKLRDCVYNIIYIYVYALCLVL